MQLPAYLQIPGCTSQSHKKNLVRYSVYRLAQSVLNFQFHSVHNAHAVNAEPFLFRLARQTCLAPNRAAYMRLNTCTALPRGLWV